jgi:hypothetical protein
MKKIVNLVLLFMIIGIFSAFAQSGRTVTYDGITYQVVTTARDFLLAYRDSKPAALIFKINDYQRTMSSINTEGQRLNIDITQAFSPSTIARASNLELYSMMEAFTVLQGGTLSPNVDAYVFNSVRPSSGNTSRLETVNNLRNYYKYLAGLWWPRLTADQRNSRMCDSCYKSISYGDGYAYGFYASGNLAVYRLWCNTCMEERLNDYRENGNINEGGFFDPIDISRANAYANERR